MKDLQKKIKEIDTVFTLEWEEVNQKCKAEMNAMIDEYKDKFKKGDVFSFKTNYFSGRVLLEEDGLKYIPGKGVCILCARLPNSAYQDITHAEIKKEENNGNKTEK
jgi:hypothetical protein